MGTPTYLLVDGENIDATLGTSVLGRRPDPDERPRWDRVLHYCNSIWDQDTLTRGLFFLKCFLPAYANGLCTSLTSNGLSSGSAFCIG